MVKRIILAWLLLAAPCFGALATNNLTASFLDTDGTSCTTASISPTANALVVMFLLASDNSSAPESPTGITGTNWANGLTWTLNDSLTVTHGTTGSAKLHVYTAVAPGSVTGGTITATFSGTHEKFVWWVVQWTDTVTPVVVQTKTASASGDSTATFDVTPEATNGSVAWGAVGANVAIAINTGFTNYAGNMEYADQSPAWINIASYDTATPPSAATADVTGGNTGVIYVEVGQPAASGLIHDPIVTPNSGLDPIIKTAE